MFQRHLFCVNACIEELRAIFDPTIFHEMLSIICVVLQFRFKLFTLYVVHDPVWQIMFQLAKSRLCLVSHMSYLAVVEVLSNEKLVLFLSVISYDAEPDDSVVKVNFFEFQLGLIQIRNLLVYCFSAYARIFY